MSTNTLTAKIRELKELKAMRDELEAEITSIEDELKAEMTAQGKDEITVDVYKLRYTVVESKRFNSSAFKQEMPELYSKYTKVSTARRFSIKNSSCNNRPKHYKSHTNTHPPRGASN